MNSMKLSAMALMVSCLGSTAMAGQQYQLVGRDGMELAQTVLGIEPLDTQETADGLGVSTGKVVCEFVTPKKGPADVMCSFTQTSKYYDVRTQKEVLGTDTYQVGNSMDIFRLLQESGAKARGNKITVQSLKCEVSGEMQSGDPGEVGEFLPVSGSCTVVQ